MLSIVRRDECTTISTTLVDFGKSQVSDRDARIQDQGPWPPDRCESCCAFFSHKHERASGQSKSLTKAHWHTPWPESSMELCLFSLRLGEELAILDWCGNLTRCGKNIYTNALQTLQSTFITTPACGPALVQTMGAESDPSVTVETVEGM